MKRLILTLAAVAAVAGPMTAAAPAFAQPRDQYDNGRHRGWDNDRRDRRDDRRYERREDRWDRRDDHWDRRDNRWDNRSAWDRGRHNGYYYQERWYYGPPPQAYYGNPYYRPGYAQWRRGGVLPNYYRGSHVSDYSRYHLRSPPRGYAWYRVGDDYLLAAIATGLIFEIIQDN